MMKQLNVILLGAEVGTLEQSADGRLSFCYAAEWLERGRPLSQSLPLRPEAFAERECAPFFGGLLPEEQSREIVAQNLGITARNDYAMLREIGGECAGAISLIPFDALPTDPTRTYAPISNAELIDLLAQLPQRPLLAGKPEIRLSLAGAQNKVALRLDESGNYSIPLNESPSTHIIKPESERFPGVAENEAYCLKLAAEVGLNVCQAEARKFGPHSCLLVTRYDRVIRGDTVERLHQEDFCQALAISSRTKYQNEGGPSLAQSFDLLRRASASPARDLIQLFNAVLFNYLIGNHDAHGKNFSLLYSPLGERFSVRLAPFYDLISTAIYSELTTKMAMKIGKGYEPAELRLRDWELYWEAIGFSKKQALRQTIQFVDLVNQRSAAETDIQKSIQAVIQLRSAALRQLL